MRMAVEESRTGQVGHRVAPSRTFPNTPNLTVGLLVMLALHPYFSVRHAAAPTKKKEPDGRVSHCYVS
jgi:hypothetical protein